MFLSLVALIRHFCIRAGWNGHFTDFLTVFHCRLLHKSRRRFLRPNEETRKVCHREQTAVRHSNKPIQNRDLFQPIVFALVERYTAFFPETGQLSTASPDSARHSEWNTGTDLIMPKKVALSYMKVPCSLTLCLHYGIHRLVSRDVFVTHSVQDQKPSDCICICLESKNITHLL